MHWKQAKNLLSSCQLRGICPLWLVIAAHVLLHVAIFSVSVPTSLVFGTSLAHAACFTGSTRADNAMMKVLQLLARFVVTAELSRR